MQIFVRAQVKKEVLFRDQFAYGMAIELAQCRTAFFANTPVLVVWSALPHCAAQFARNSWWSRDQNDSFERRVWLGEKSRASMAEKLQVDWYARPIGTIECSDGVFRDRVNGVDGFAGIPYKRSFGETCFGTEFATSLKTGEP